MRVDGSSHGASRTSAELRALMEVEIVTVEGGAPKTIWKMLAGTKDEGWKMARAVLERRATRCAPNLDEFCLGIRRSLQRRPPS